MGLVEYIQAYFSYGKVMPLPLTVADISGPFYETYTRGEECAPILRKFKTAIDPETHLKEYNDALDAYYKDQDAALEALARGKLEGNDHHDNDIYTVDDEPQPSTGLIEYHRELALAKLEGRLYENALTSRSNFGDDVTKRTFLMHPYNHKVNALGYMTTDYRKDFVNIVGPPIFLPKDSGIYVDRNRASDSSLPKPEYMKPEKLQPTTTDDVKRSLKFGLSTVFPSRGASSTDATRITGLTTLVSSTTQVSFTNVTATAFTHKAFFDEFTIVHDEAEVEEVDSALDEETAVDFNDSDEGMSAVESVESVKNEEVPVATPSEQKAPIDLDAWRRAVLARAEAKRKLNTSASDTTSL